MKTLVGTFVALTFVAGVVGPAIAAEPFSIKTLDQEGRGGHGPGKRGMVVRMRPVGRNVGGPLALAAAITRHRCLPRRSKSVPSH